jgi:hypothetical protein
MTRVDLTLFVLNEMHKPSAQAETMTKEYQSVLKTERQPPTAHQNKDPLERSIPETIFAVQVLQTNDFRH